jgi:hypothetical protein
LWRDATAAYELRVDELITLESACRTADTINRLDEAMKGEPLTVKGSMGQVREHPLLAEARQQRALLSRLFVALKFPDAPEAASRHAGERSAKARAAVQARWARRGAS